MHMENSDSQAAIWMENILSYTSTGLRLQNVMADKSAMDWGSRQQKKITTTWSDPNSPCMSVCMHTRLHLQRNCMVGSNGQTVPNCTDCPGIPERGNAFAPILTRSEKTDIHKTRNESGLFSCIISLLWSLAGMNVNCKLINVDPLPFRLWSSVEHGGGNSWLSRQACRLQGVFQDCVSRRKNFIPTARGWVVLHSQCLSWLPAPVGFCWKLWLMRELGSRSTYSVFQLPVNAGVS